MTPSIECHTHTSTIYNTYMAHIPIFMELLVDFLELMLSCSLPR